VIDVYTRAALAIEIGQRLRGEHVVAVLNRLVQKQGAPPTRVNYGRKPGQIGLGYSAHFDLPLLEVGSQIDWRVNLEISSKVARGISSCAKMRRADSGELWQLNGILTARPMCTEGGLLIHFSFGSQTLPCADFGGGSNWPTEHNIVALRLPKYILQTRQ
jgi:hypothetical protein